MPSTAFTSPTRRRRIPVVIGKCLTNPRTESSSSPSAPAGGADLSDVDDPAGRLMPVLATFRAGMRHQHTVLADSLADARSYDALQLRSDVAFPRVPALLVGHVTPHPVPTQPRHQVRHDRL